MWASFLFFKICCSWFPSSHLIWGTIWIFKLGSSFEILFPPFHPPPLTYFLDFLQFQHSPTMSVFSLSHVPCINPAAVFLFPFWPTVWGTCSITATDSMILLSTSESYFSSTLMQCTTILALINDCAIQTHTVFVSVLFLLWHPQHIRFNPVAVRWLTVSRM